MSLIVRLFILVLLTLLPAVAVLAYMQVDLRQRMLANIHEDALTLARLAASEQDEILEGAKNLLIALDAVLQLEQATTACNGLLARIEPEYARYLAIGAIASDGRVLCSNIAADAADLVDVVAPRHHPGAIPAGFAVEERRRWRDQDVLPLLYPLHGQGEAADGVLVLLLDLAWLDTAFATRPLPPGAALAITDRSGSVLVRVPSLDVDPRAYSTPNPFAELARHPQGGTIEMAGVDGRHRIFGYVPTDIKPDGLFVAVGLDRAAATASVDTATLWGVTIIVLTVSVALATAWIGHRRFILAPLRTLSTAAQRWREGDSDARVGAIDAPPEFTSLGAAFDSMAESLTERERKLRDAYEAAKEANAVRGRLLAAAGHDLRQPLQAIALAAEALRGSAAEVAQRRMLDLIDRAARKLGRALDTLLQASVQQFRQQQPQRHSFPVQDLLDEVADEWALAAREKGLGFHVHPCRLEIVSDRDMLATVINNFVGNAIRYTERGRVVIGCRRRGESVGIGVCDTGIGIPAEMLDSVFDEFRQVSTTRREGFGLGLAIVRRTAETLGHRLIVRSRLGRGSCFAIEVPLAGREGPGEKKGTGDVRHRCLPSS